jgi:ribonuclease Z
MALGTGGRGANPLRAHPALLLTVGKRYRVLIDAGDGTFFQLAKLYGPKRLDAVILTALGPERLAGLVGILDSGQKRTPHDAPLLVGPHGTADIHRLLGDLMRTTLQVSDVVEVGDPWSLKLGPATLTVEIVDTGNHGQVLGVRLSEADVSGAIDREALARLGLDGDDVPRLKRGEQVNGVSPEQVIGPRRAGRVLAVLGPCRPTTKASDCARDAGVVFVVAPYIDERYDTAVDEGVMTGVEAATLGHEAAAKAVVLMHLNGTTRPEYAKKEAGRFHPRVIIPNDGDMAQLPAPGSGLNYQRANSESRRRAAPQRPGHR